ncbi:hypothetical protein HAHE_37640 [Haloferula helveola]|uniref:Uncharacterized protein n=1 Tax=Haloferula helveola TaxID=490095 RepID=A0ABN6H873_9BACT|nr:hypothetical protein HAHE_37640 [Haloferula helveola]
MTSAALFIRSVDDGTEYACQKLNLIGSHPLGGNLECPQVFDVAGRIGRVFEVVPLGFKIKITPGSAEPKQPTFVVES